MDLKPYHKLACADMSVISQKIHALVADRVASGERGWIFLDLKQVLTAVPELVIFFKQHNLKPKEAAVTILYEDFDAHIDTLPVVAKVNMPVANTQGWVNRWYAITDEELAACPAIVDPLGFAKEDVSAVPLDRLAGEIADLDCPIVFNSRIIHSVDMVNPQALPRVIASFTFFNDPVHLL